MRRRTLYSTPGALLVVLLLGLAACGGSATEFRMRMLPEDAKGGGSPLSPIFEQESRVRIVHVPTESGLSGLELLTNGDVDLALVENSSPFHSGVRAVLPVFKSVLHLLTNDNADFTDPEQPLRDKTIFIHEGSAAGKAFLRITASRQQLEPDEYNIVTALVPGETDMIIYFGPINPRDHSWYVNGFSLYSMNNDDLERALSSEAISYLLPQMQPKIIPAHTYNLPGNDEAVYSLEVDTILATKKSASEDDEFLLFNMSWQFGPPPRD